MNLSTDYTYPDEGYPICTRVNLSYLPGETPLGDEDDDQEMEYRNGDGEDSFKSFKAHLRQAVEDYEDYPMGHWESPRGEGAQRIRRMAFVEAVTSVPGQEKAEKYLEKLGFIKVGPFTKKKHDYTVVTVWIMAVSEFLDKIGYE